MAADPVIAMIDTAIATLQGQLPAAVTAHNADTATTVDIAAPATYHFGATDLLDAFPFPQIEVAAGTGRTGNWDVNRDEVDHDTTLQVILWLQGDTGEVPRLYRQSLSYRRPIINILRVTGALGAGVEISNEPGGIFWRADVIGAELTLEERSLRVWRAPLLIQFQLEDVDRFA